MTRLPELCFLIALLPMLVGTTARSAEESDPLAPWRGSVAIRAVSPEKERHTMHSYFNTCPESPDGTSVLFFASTARDGHRGEVVVRDRASGKEKAISAPINAEDAHRVACQQWLSGGKRVVFHGEREGIWSTWCVDLATGKERELARGQLAGWGRPDADIVPLYSPHWNPGTHPDLDLINVATGEKQTPVTVAALRDAYPDWYQKSFGEHQPSIFFPVLSPDRGRVFFKMAVATGDDPRSKSASARQGLICYDLAAKRFLYMNPQWGHPSWQPDSRHITEVQFSVYDSNDGSRVRIPGLPAVRGDHPSTSPDGRLIVTDTTLDKFGGSEREWGIVLADAHGGAHLILHRFNNAGGAASWRRSHPHPVFSADGRRIYFNISDGAWTRLFVAERP